MFGPVWGDRREENGLQGGIFSEEGARHRCASGGARFAVEVSGGLEVVEGGFQGEFVIRAEGRC